MSRGSPELRDIVRDVERPFESGSGVPVGSTGATTPQLSLWLRNDALEEYVAGLWNPTADLPDTLSFKQPVYSKDARDDIDQVAAKLNRPLELRIQPHSPLTRDETKADQLEAVEANRLIRLGIASGSSLWTSILTGLGYKVYVPVWLETEPYVTPAKHPGEKTSDFVARVKRYEQEWFGWRLTVDPVRTSSWLAEGRRITLGVRHRKIPYLDLAEYSDVYQQQRDPEAGSDADRELRLRVCEQEFPGLRGDSANRYDVTTSNRNEIEVFEVADGASVAHYIASAPKNGVRDYQEVGVYDVPLGRVPLYVVCGRYEEAAPLELRYQPLRLPLLENLRSRDRVRSLLASYLASSAKDALITTPEGLQAWADNAETLRKSPVTINGRNYAVVPGQFAASQADAEQIQLAEQLLNDINSQISRQRGILATDWSQNVIQNAPASTVLHAVEEEQQYLQGALDEITTFVRDVAESTTYMAAFGLNQHYTPGGTSKAQRAAMGERAAKAARSPDVAMTAVMTGAEAGYLRPGRSVDAGKTITLGPEDVDFSYTRSVSTRDESVSATRARASAALQLWDRADGVKLIDYDKLLEECGYSNVAQEKDKIRADQLFQLNVPDVIQQAKDQAAKFIAAFLGTTPDQLPTTDTQVEPQQQPGAAGSTQAPSGAGYHMEAPTLNSPTGQSQGAAS